MASEAELLAAADFAKELQSWRERRGLSKRALAERMSYDRTYVIHIEGGRMTPTADFTRRAEEVLATDGALWSVWNTFQAVRGQPRKAAPPGTTRDLRNPAYLSWLTDRSGLSFHEAYNAVAHLVDDIERQPPAVRHATVAARARVSQQDITAAVVDYYADGGTADHGMGLVRADVDGVQVDLTILARPGWLDLAISLDTGHERTRLGPARSELWTTFDVVGCRAALRRLAEVEASDTVLVNNPLYRLVKLDLDHESLNATFDTTDFLTYALRGDLLEVELVDELCEDIRSTGRARGRPEGLPLRQRYLPDVASALDLAGRPCVGGIDALVAIARDGGDYMLLVQERSNGCSTSQAGSPLSRRRFTSRPSRRAWKPTCRPP